VIEACHAGKEPYVPASCDRVGFEDDERETFDIVICIWIQMDMGECEESSALVCRKSSDAFVQKPNGVRS
jgi:hypothetical protein